MSDNAIDVLLVTADPALAEAVEHCRPPEIRSAYYNPVRGSPSVPAARQIWIDLDSDVAIASLPTSERRVYFHSTSHPPDDALPPGIFVRKPSNRTALRILWASVSEGAAASLTAHPNPATLPGWLLDLHELDLRMLCQKIVAIVADRLGFGRAALYVCDENQRNLTLAESNCDFAIDLLIRLAPDTDHALSRACQFDLVRAPLGLAAACASNRWSLPALPAALLEAPALLLPLLGDSAAVGLLCLYDGVPTADGGRSHRSDSIPAGPGKSTRSGSANVNRAADRDDAPPRAAVTRRESASRSSASDDTVSRSSPHGGTAPTAETLRAIAAFLARSLQHARQFDRARTEARVDGLTGLFNYRWLCESLEKEIHRADRYAAPLSILVVDLDEFKPLNDAHGHIAGDAVLRHVAARIAAVLRQTDSAARIGGDEFVVLLPATDAAGAAHAADRIRASIRENDPLVAEKHVPIGVSVGTATWQAGWDAIRFLQEADNSMYCAKRTARGRPRLPTALLSPAPAGTFTPDPP